MKIVITFLLLWQATLFQAQSLKTTKFQINEISFKISKVQDLQEINWDEIKTIFAKNDAEDEIKIGFTLDLQQTTNKLNSTFVVSGQSKNLDDLISKAQKGTNILVKLATQNTK